MLAASVFGFASAAASVPGVLNAPVPKTPACINGIAASGMSAAGAVCEEISFGSEGSVGSVGSINAYVGSTGFSISLKSGVCGSSGSVIVICGAFCFGSSGISGGFTVSFARGA